MIVIIGNPLWNPGAVGAPAGMVCAIALAAVRDGARAELVGRIGDDPDGDALVIALARLGIGHAALLRDPARPTGLALPAPEADEIEFSDDCEVSLAGDTGGPELDPGDISLGLQYVAEFSVLVATGSLPPVASSVCVDGAGFAGAHLIMVVPRGSSTPSNVPASATVLEPPAGETAAFAELVGCYAAGLDRRLGHAAAFEAAIAPSWERPST